LGEHHNFNLLGYPNFSGIQQVFPIHSIAGLVGGDDCDDRGELDFLGSHSLQLGSGEHLQVN
jgi:hypothetical protein